MDDLPSFAMQEISRYLIQRPDAADTAEGVHHWWIQWPDSAAPMAVTLAALEQLERDGLMQHIRIGSRDIWRRRQPAASSGD